MKAAQGNLETYHYILDNCTRAEVDLALDEIRQGEIIRQLTTGMNDEDTIKTLRAEMHKYNIIGTGTNPATRKDGAKIGE